VTADERRRVVVIGAGISGLAAAHHLRSIAPAVDVVVLERSDRVGGMVQTEVVDGRVIESGPEGFVSNRPEALDLVDAVGLSDEIVVDGPAPRQTFIARGDRLLPLPYGVMNPDRTAAADLLRSPLLSVRGRLRLMAEPLMPRRHTRSGSSHAPSSRWRWWPRWNGRVSDGEPAGDESVAAFVRRRFGDEMLSALVDPLIGGIHGSSTDELSAEMLVPALRRIELDGRSVALAALRRGRSGSERSLPPLVSLRRGMGSLVDAVADQLDGSIRLGIGVTAIEPAMAPSALSATRPAARSDGSTSVGSGGSSGGPGGSSSGGPGGSSPAEPDSRRGPAGRQTGSSPSRWLVRCDDGSTLEADAVVVATPPAVTAQLLAPLAGATAAEVAAMPWGSSTTVGLAWAPGQVTLDMGTGYMVPAGEGGVVAACTFTTAKWHHRSADGSTMVRCFMRGEGVDSMTDEDLVSAARDELRRRVGVTAAPAEASVRRVPAALPVMKVGHRARVRSIHAGLDGLTGLTLAGGGLEGAGLPACIRSGRLAADRVLASLSS
jgi:protoporphyrinogen/coproporphyrinogen III oxidase